MDPLDQLEPLVSKGFKDPQDPLDLGATEVGQEPLEIPVVVGQLVCKARGAYRGQQVSSHVCNIIICMNIICMPFDNT